LDENAYREAYRAANPIACAYAKAILTGHFRCDKSARVLLAERVAVSCKTLVARDKCAALLEVLRHKALFALKIIHVDGEIPHAKEMKVQCGGLLGLQGVLYPELAGNSTEVENIFALVEEVQRRFEDLDTLPYGDIIKSVANFEGRRRRV
jgi:hypothetical protein